jgi:hypothetical protein
LIFVFISFQVCDEPHPLLVKEMMQYCINGNVAEAYKVCHMYLIVNPNLKMNLLKPSGVAQCMVL